MDPIEQTLEWEALSRKEFGPSAEDMGYDSDDDNDFEEELLNAPFNEYMDGAYGYSTESKYPIISSWDQFDKVVIGGSAEFSVCENPVAIDEHVEMSGGCDFAGTGYSAATTARDATVLRGLDLGRAWTLNADSEAVVSSSETCALERVMPELTLGVKCDLEKLNVLA